MRQELGGRVPPALLFALCTLHRHLPCPALVGRGSARPRLVGPLHEPPLFFHFVESRRPARSPNPANRNSTGACSNIGLSPSAVGPRLVCESPRAGDHVIRPPLPPAAKRLCCSLSGTQATVTMAGLAGTRPGQGLVRPCATAFTRPTDSLRSLVGMETFVGRGEIIGPRRWAQP